MVLVHGLGVNSWDNFLTLAPTLSSAGHLGLAVDPNVAQLVLSRLDLEHSKPFRCLPFTTTGM